MEVAHAGPVERDQLCVHPLHDVVIDYNGKAPICCETMSDFAGHESAIVGDLNQEDYSLFHLYRDMAPFRENLLGRGKKLGVCSTCFAAPFVHNRYGRAPGMAAALGRVPGLRTAFERAHSRHLKTLSQKILD